MRDHLYSYRRMLPHYQKAGSPIFITFRKLLRDELNPEARSLILGCCVGGHGRKFQLHAAVVMPDHVHLILTPLIDATGWPLSLPGILKSLKGASARAVNRYMGISGPVWQDESFDHVLRNDEEHAREDGVHSAESGEEEIGDEGRRLSVVVDRAWVLIRFCLYGADILPRKSCTTPQNIGPEGFLITENRNRIPENYRMQQLFLRGQECPRHTSKPTLFFAER